WKVGPGTGTYDAVEPKDVLLLEISDELSVSGPKSLSRWVGSICLARMKDRWTRFTSSPCEPSWTVGLGMTPPRCCASVSFERVSRFQVPRRGDAIKCVRHGAERSGR